MAFLLRRLDVVKVVDPREQKSASAVFFGARGTREDEAGKHVTYQIVGEDETDAKGGRISLASPMGQALIKRKLGEWVTVRRPAGEIDVRIVEINYG
jgi:transcription elongation factor GreB